MPPKRAAKTATKAAPAADQKTPATRATRSRAQKSTPPQEESAEDSSVNRSTRTRQTRNSDQNAPAQAEEAAKSDATPQPRTKQRPLTRGRPPRTVKKVAPSQANKQTLDALKKRMEEDRRATKAGVVPQSVPETRQEQAERAVREAENNDGNAAMVPARPAPRSPSPTRQTKMPGTAVKAPATVTRPQSALKMQSTPGAETSVLALQNFKRRPRQPSLLQMVQNPNLAGTPIDDTTDFSLGSLGDEDDFAPHDESTPLQLSKAKQIEVEQEPEDEVEDEQEQEQEQEQRAQTPPQVPDDDEDLYGATPRRATQRQSRKRKSDAIEESEIQVTRSSPSLPHSPSRSIVEAEEYETIPATAPEDDDEEPATTESQQRRLLSDTYADPLSSSPPPDPISPSSPAQQRPRSPVISPSTARRNARGATSKTVKPLTTATLRAMLPKRRNQRASKGDYDFPSSSSHEPTSSAFEDEKRKRPKPKKQPAPKKKAPVTKKPTSRTYARANKQNETIHLSSGSSSLSELNSDELAADETADTSLETVTAGDDKISDELKKARDLFKDVDQWEMEFESASLGAGGGDSSPWR